MNEAISSAKQAWALVTGASSGIGEEFSRQLAARGYQLVLVARRRQRLEALAADLAQEYGTSSHIITADLTHADACQQIADELQAQQITVEFLVNNAGYGVPGRLVTVDWATHEDFLRIMVNAVCQLSWLLSGDTAEVIRSGAIASEPIVDMAVEEVERQFDQQ